VQVINDSKLGRLAPAASPHVMETG
jgi:hypothetical protein